LKGKKNTGRTPQVKFAKKPKTTQTNRERRKGTKGESEGEGDLGSRGKPSGALSADSIFLSKKR